MLRKLNMKIKLYIQRHLTSQYRSISIYLHYENVSRVRINTSQAINLIS